MDLQSLKQRFGVIGSSPLLDRALEVALRVAATDLSVLVSGESGVGKEFFPQIIHAFSARKHNKYIAVNCGAIPGGTIDSELFGHEKGAFTGASEARKGYFEEANGGTIFLDEVAELPLATQVRLLRVLQDGEYIRVGSSKVQKTDVRVVAATNIDLQRAIGRGRFREDLYYRLNTVPIHVPALRERRDDICLLFRKFAVDVATQYRMPVIALDSQAQNMLETYLWPGNVRQLKNVAEQISAVEQTRNITAYILRKYLPAVHTAPQVLERGELGGDERELLYKVLFELRAEVSDLRRTVSQMRGGGAVLGGGSTLDGGTALGSGSPGGATLNGSVALDGAGLSGGFTGRGWLEEQGHTGIAGLLPAGGHGRHAEGFVDAKPVDGRYAEGVYTEAPVVQADEAEATPATKEEAQRDQIIRALRRHSGRRKDAARELFISERTLYRKIKELGIEFSE